MWWGMVSETNHNYADTFACALAHSIGTEIREPPGLSFGTFSSYEGLEEQENRTQSLLAPQI